MKMGRVIADAFLAAIVVEVMNEALAADPDAIEQLINHRVVCNEALANHPTIQCLKDGDQYRVGLLGILNALCTPWWTEENREGLVAAVFDDKTGKLTGFVATQSFQVK